MEYIKKYLMRIDRDRKLQMIGPADEPISKVADMYRKVLYIKQEDIQLLLKAKEQLERYIEINTGFKNIRIQFTMNH